MAMSMTLRSLSSSKKSWSSQSGKSSSKMSLSSDVAKGMERTEVTNTSACVMRPALAIRKPPSSVVRVSLLSSNSTWMICSMGRTSPPVDWNSFPPTKPQAAPLYVTLPCADTLHPSERRHDTNSLRSMFIIAAPEGDTDDIREWDI